MKKLILAVILAASSTHVFAATAFWTGRKEQAQTVTSQWAWNCEYNYFGQTFWRVFKKSCPSSVEVQ